VQALRTWPARGIPDNPAGWIILTARNKAIDRLRRERIGAVKAGEAEELPGSKTWEMTCSRFPTSAFG
jgi:predicted RNA polymerase sigma factor